MKTDNILEHLKQLFIENNRINLKDKLLEKFWTELPKEEYSKYIVIFPYSLKDKFNFNSDLVNLDGILFSEYMDKIYAVDSKGIKDSFNYTISYTKV